MATRNNGYRAAAWFLLAAGLLSGGPSQADHALTRVADVRQLTPTEAAWARPVQVSGVVTALSGWKNSFFLQNSGTGISVDRTDTVEVHSGDLVQVFGVTAEGLFAPVIVAHRVVVLGRAKLPPAESKTYAELATGNSDSQWVQVEGTVRSTAVSSSWGRQVLFLRIDTGSGLIVARVHDFPSQDFGYFVDAHVQVRGVCGTNFDERRRFVGLRLFVPDLSDIVIKEPSPADPFAIPESSINGLFRFTSSQPGRHRVKISGVVTYQQPGSLLYVQEQHGEGLAVSTTDARRLPPGTRIEAAGFAATGEYSPVLEDAVIRILGMGAPPKPVLMNASRATRSNNGFLFAPYDGELVETAGEVISQVDHPGRSVWYLRDGKTVFEAQLDDVSERLPAPVISPRSRVRLTGICAAVTDSNRDPKGFRILLRGPGDIVVTSSGTFRVAPSVWFLAIFGSVFFVGVIWALQLRRVLLAAPSHTVQRSGSLPARFLSASVWIARAVILTALAVLIGGWAFHIRSLIQMRVNTALCFALIGVGTWLYSRARRGGVKYGLSAAAVSTVILIALLTSIECLFGADFGIDQILSRDASVPVLTDRMPFVIAVSLLFLSAGELLLWHSRRVWIAQTFVLTAGTTCLMNALGVLYGAPHVLGIRDERGMPLVSAVSGLAVCVALLFSQPDTGIMRVVSSDAPGGILARRLLPGAIAIPTILGWLRWQGQMNGLYATNTGLVLFASANIVVFSILIWMNTALLNRLDVDRLRAETQTRMADEANRAKDAFLAVISHEIRTPMNAILGMADLLSESSLATTQRRYVDVLRRTASNLMVLINDILDLSKIEAGKLTLESIDFDLKEIAEEAMETVEAKARAKRLDLRMDFEQALPTRVMGDSLRLRQVLINLLGNAVKFTESGSITLTVRRDSELKRAIQFAISDTGIGIAADKLETIFHDFTQADSSTTRKHEGTGLGLSITRRLVRLMGGEIHVTSFPGKGSTFSFAVPFELAEQRNPLTRKLTETPREHKAGLPLRILVADDSADNRLLIEMYLKETPYSLTFAEDGQDAVDKFQETNFDLVLMDIRMPILDGLAATRAIRALEQARDAAGTPILALTANARPADLAACIQAGCDAHLSKPIAKTRLLQAIDEYAQNGRRVDKSVDAEHSPAARRTMIQVPEGLEEIAPSYLAARKEEVALSTRALRDYDFDRIRALAHNWKGTGSSYGFDDLTTLGTAIENSATRHDALAVQEQLAQLQGYLDEIQLPENQDSYSQTK
jgi:signal transduction histidine kinase/CheY-like chemotaxis protein/HPt (histidine-containing phosphotransfer) domain-containing protein